MGAFTRGEENSLSVSLCSKHVREESKVCQESKAGQPEADPTEYPYFLSLSAEWASQLPVGIINQPDNLKKRNQYVDNQPHVFCNLSLPHRIASLPTAAGQQAGQQYEQPVGNLADNPEHDCPGSCSFLWQSHHLTTPVSNCCQSADCSGSFLPNSYPMTAEAAITIPRIFCNGCNILQSAASHYNELDVQLVCGYNISESDNL